MSAHKFPGRHTEERDRLKKHTDRPKTKYSTVLNLKDITEPPSLERLYEHFNLLIQLSVIKINNPYL